MINLPIGQILISNGLITEEQLKIALDEQKRTKGQRLGDIMLRMGFITESQYLNALAVRLNIPFMRSAVAEVDARLLKIVPYDTAVKYEIMPATLEDGVLGIMTSDPLDFYKLDNVRIITGLSVKPILALQSDIEASINACYSSEARRTSADRADVTAVASDIVAYLEGRGYRGVEVSKTDKEIYVKISLAK